MKSFYIFLMLLFLLGGRSQGQSYGSITDINNNTSSLDSLAGHKVLIVLLPMQRDTAVAHQLVRFQHRHVGAVKVVGLVCIGNGYPTADSLRSWYGRAITAGVIVTEGMQATDSVRNERETMLQWLSGKSRNRQAEVGVSGAKYFLSEHGKLFANAGYATSLDSKVVDNIIRTKVPGEQQ